MDECGDIHEKSVRMIPLNPNHAGIGKIYTNKRSKQPEPINYIVYRYQNLSE